MLHLQVMSKRVGALLPDGYIRKGVHSPIFSIVPRDADERPGHGYRRHVQITHAESVIEGARH